METKRNLITLFLPSLRGGGAERVMVNLARGFAEQGFKVDLVLTKAEGPYLSQIPSNVRVIDLNAHRVLYSILGLIRYLRQEKPQAILSALDHANVVSVWAKKLSRVPTPVLVTVHSTLSRASANATSIRVRITPLLVRIFYPWADAIVAVSEGIANDLSDLTGISRKKINVIYNPIINDELIQKSNQKINDEWVNQSEAPVILSVGRLTEAKDFETLIQAFKKVHDKIKSKLLILGEGEKRNELEKLINSLNLEDDVRMPGFVENPYVYMRRASIFVLSSKFEGLPTVLVEAMACNLPIISTNCTSGPSEILENGKYGKLVPVGNIDMMAEAILDFINNKQIMKLKYDNLDRYTVEKSTENYIKLLRMILNEKNIKST